MDVGDDQYLHRPDKKLRMDPGGGQPEVSRHLDAFLQMMEVTSAPQYCTAVSGRAVSSGGPSAALHTVLGLPRAPPAQQKAEEGSAISQQRRIIRG